MKDKGWVATAKIFTIIPLVLAGFSLYGILTVYKMYLESFGFGNLKTGFILETLIDVILWSTLFFGAVLFLFNKRYGWILSVSGMLVVFGMVIPNLARSSNDISLDGAVIFLTILVGILSILYLITLFTRDVRSTFDIKKRELQITVLITVACIIVNYLY